MSLVVGAVISTVWKAARTNGKRESTNINDQASGNVSLGDWKEYIEGEFTNKLIEKVATRLQKQHDDHHNRDDSSSSKSL